MKSKLSRRKKMLLYKCGKDDSLLATFPFHKLTVDFPLKNFRGRSKMVKY